MEEEGAAVAAAVSVAEAAAVAAVAAVAGAAVVAGGSYEKIPIIYIWIFKGDENDVTKNTR